MRGSLELFWWREAVEDQADLPEHTRHEVLERPRVLEPAEGDIVVMFMRSGTPGGLSRFP